MLIDNTLFRRNSDGVFLRCLDNDETETILTKLHSIPVGSHFGGEITTDKIIRAGYYWPTLFQYSYTFVKKYQECQIYTDRVKNPPFPLHTITI